MNSAACPPLPWFCPLHFYKSERNHSSPGLGATQGRFLSFKKLCLFSEEACLLLVVWPFPCRLLSDTVIRPHCALCRCLPGRLWLGLCWPGEQAGAALRQPCSGSGIFLESAGHEPSSVQHGAFHFPCQCCSHVRYLVWVTGLCLESVARWSGIHRCPYLRSDMVYSWCTYM